MPKLSAEAKLTQSKYGICKYPAALFCLLKVIIIQMIDNQSNVISICAKQMR